MLLLRKYVSNQIPIHTSAMSTLPYSEELVHLYTFKTPYDDEIVCGVIKNGNSATLSVPRESVPYAEVEDDYRVFYPTNAIDCKFKARHEQQELCDQSIDLLKHGVCHIFEAPTGHGKTVEGSYIACKIGQPTLIIVTKEDLVSQWRDTLINVLGIPVQMIGHIQQDVCDWKCKQFVIGMVHSLIIPDRYPLEMYKYFGMVIFDEVHKMAADCFVRACQLFPAKYRLGFSATPDRKDGKTKLLNWHIGPTMVRGKVIAMKPKILVRQTGWKIPKRRKLVGNSWEWITIPYSPGRMMHITKIMAGSEYRNLEIVNFIVQTYNSDRRCLILSDMLQHLECLFQLITSNGIPGNVIGKYVGGMSKLELELSKVKKIILATFKMADTGTDVPIWDTLVMATPRADIKQPIGRVMRSQDGKRQPVILDLVDYDSIFQSFFQSRMKQYYELGAEIIKM